MVHERLACGSGVSYPATLRSHASSYLSSCQKSRWLTEAIRIYPHHIPLAVEGPEHLPFASRFDAAGMHEGPAHPDQDLGHIQFRLVLHDLSVSWRMFAGRDWGEREAGGEKHEDGGKKAAGGKDGVEAGSGSRRRSSELLQGVLGEVESEKGEGLGLGKERVWPATGGRRRIRGGAAAGSGRNAECMVEVCLSHVFAKVDTFVPGHSTSSCTLLSIKDFHVLDRINTVQQRKILGYW